MGRREAAVAAEETPDAAPTPVTPLRVDVRALHRAIGGALAAVLVGAAVAVAVLRGGSYATLPGGRALVSWLHLDSEQALPAVFSAALISCAAGLVVVLTLVAEPTHSARRMRGRWRALAAVLVLIALDELMVVHETVSVALRDALGTSGGLLHHAWIVPYLLLGAVVAAVMLRPLLALPRRTRTLIVAAGSAYVVGAAGAKVVEALLGEPGPLASEVLVTVEELLEIGGMWLLVGALLRELAGRRVQIELPRPDAPPAG